MPTTSPPPCTNAATVTDPPETEGLIIAAAEVQGKKRLINAAACVQKSQKETRHHCKGNVLKSIKKKSYYKESKGDHTSLQRKRTSVPKKKKEAY
jgi:hypothetical protein